VLQWKDKQNSLQQELHALLTSVSSERETAFNSLNTANLNLTKPKPATENSDSLCSPQTAQFSILKLLHSKIKQEGLDSSKTDETKLLIIKLLAPSIEFR